VGQRRGLFSFGELVVLVYNFREDKVLTVRSLRGYSIFARFAELQDFTGISLEELRRRSAGAGKKSALIQAVEAVEKHLQDFLAANPEEAAVSPAEPAKTAKPAAEAEPAKYELDFPQDEVLENTQVIPRRQKQNRRNPGQKKTSARLPAPDPEAEPAAQTEDPAADE